MRFGKKQIILSVATLVLICALIAANIALSVTAPLLHQVFSGDSTDYDSTQAENALVAGDELVQDIAEDSMVLLRNENDVLPLGEDAKFNLFGWNATDQGFMLTGGGSGGTVIAADNKVTLAQAFKKEGVQYNEQLLKAYSDYNPSYDADANASANSWDLVNPPATFYTDALLSQSKGYSDTAVVVLSRFARENGGAGELISAGSYSNGSILELTANEKAMMDAVSKNFDKVVVLLNTSNNMELAFLEDYDVDAALYVGLPGQSGASAIPLILTGKATPSGRTADTYPFSYQPFDGTSRAYDPTWANSIYNGTNITYAEGIYFGYRWYETADAEHFFDNVVTPYGEKYKGVVQYSFGHGLSYADFEWQIESWPDTDTLTRDGKYKVEVRVTNKNDSKYAGKEVVQLYYTPPYYEGGIEKAHVNLLGFAKTELLEPGESQLLSIEFSAYDMASYDAYDKNGNFFCGYELDPGDYELKLMKNAHEPATCVDKEGKSAESSYLLSSASELKLESDPDTEVKVENRFTSTGAYAGVPIDGSTVVSGGVDYLTRANDFANFPTVQAAAPTDTAAVSAASNYEFRGYDGQSKPTQGVAGDKFLVTNSDGSQANAAALNGTDSDAELIPNKTLMKTLSNYDTEEWEPFLSQLSETEIKDLIGRGGFQTYYAVSVGKTLNTDRDGPAGFNMGVTNPNTNSRWTAFPVEALIGCSWNPKMAYNMGRSQGAVASATGLSGWYAPGVNLHRSPYNTRNFEYYSEDAILSGKLAAEVVRGAKQNNLYCYIKHFAVSEAGANPHNKNTWLTEQTLREIYLKPFEIAVKQGGANGIMSAFNRVGAVWAGSNHALSNEILRGEWGFRGTMITDWYNSGYMNYERGIRAGNDLWLDGTTQKSADIDMSDPATAYCARRSAKNILYTYVDTFVTALDYQENGDPNDPYKVSIDKIKVNAAAFSPLLVVLWVVLDVLLAAGIVVCLIFLVKKSKNDPPSESGERS